MNLIPHDRDIARVYAHGDDRVYHVFADDDGGVSIVVGCHIARLTADEAKMLAGAVIAKAEEASP